MRCRLSSQCLLRKNPTAAAAEGHFEVVCSALTYRRSRDVAVSLLTVSMSNHDSTDKMYVDITGFLHTRLDISLCARRRSDQCLWMGWDEPWRELSSVRPNWPKTKKGGRHSVLVTCVYRRWVSCESRGRVRLFTPRADHDLRCTDPTQEICATPCRVVMSRARIHGVDNTRSGINLPWKN